jgi:hypothetical protein
LHYEQKIRGWIGGVRETHTHTLHVIDVMQTLLPSAANRS